MEYTAQQISEILNIGYDIPMPSFSINETAFDSRKVFHSSQTLFIALKGEKQDGHSFIPGLYEKGVRNFITDGDFDSSEFAEANFFKVTDPLKALQDIASFHRKKFNIPVIGITGSNGKTIVKEWLYQLLSEQYQVTKSPKSYNSQIGVPVSVLNLMEGDEIGIFEAGISKKGEMGGIARIISPTIGIFTNIGPAHDPFFASRKEKLFEKLKLFHQCGVLIYCRDHSEIYQGLTGLKPDERPKDLLSWGVHPDSDIFIKDQNESILTFAYDGRDYKISLPFNDNASTENLMHCLSLMIFMGLDPDHFASQIDHLTNIPLRLEMKKARNNCTLIYDCYNSDLHSLLIALEFMDKQSRHIKRTAILSDIPQSNLPEPELMEQIISSLVSKNVSRLIGVGPVISGHGKSFQDKGFEELMFYNNTDELYEALDSIPFSEEVILIKGARKFNFERIGKKIESKVHNTVLEINLNALINNYQVYQKHIQKGVKTMIMVKAYSYGSGSYEIAKALQFNNVDYLAVAYTDEGIELRESGIDLPIMVMNPDRESMTSLIHYGLEPEIYSSGLLLDYVNIFKNLPGSSGIKGVHLKIDTGMHRLGFEEESIADLIAVLNKYPEIPVNSVFSHLAGSDEAIHDDYSRKQIRLFDKIYNQISKAVKSKPLKHILNSAGILRLKEFQYDMVRLGLGIYGIDTSGIVQQELEQISRLKSTVSQIKQIKAGETIGYNREAQITEDKTIATVSIGYADGYSRLFGNGTGSFLIHGREAPVIGNVCMDMTMVDISQIPEVKEGDEVVIFGPEYPIQNLAVQAGTIPYEIMSGISERVKRVYFEE